MKISFSRLFSIPWYPAAFAMYPILELFAFNISQLETVVLWRPLFLSILCSCLLLIPFRLLFSDWSHAALCTAALALLFFLYGHVYAYLKTLNLPGITLGRHRLLLAVWIVLAALVMFVAQQKKINVQAHTVTLNTIALVLLIFPVFTIISREYALHRNTLTQVEPAPNLGVQNGQSLPDVYYIILDSYTRSDVLKEVYGYDNSAFLNGLTDMGFYVAECSTSNYMWTRLSLSSTLNMEYLPENSLYAAAEDKDLATEELLKHSLVRKDFESLGYHTVAFATGFSFNEVTDADLFLEPPSSMASERGFDALLVQTSLLKVFQDFGYIHINQSASAQFRDRTLFALSEFDELAHSGGPKFVYVHIITPHPPFVFGPNGEAVDPKDFISTEGQYTADTYFDGYTDQVEFISKSILHSVQTLLDESPTSPIIIIQGDHGPWKQQGENRVSILNAYYLPGHADALYPSISPVNSFRIIFNEYFNGTYPMLEDRSYESPYANVYDFTLRPTSCDPGR